MIWIRSNIVFNISGISIHNKWQNKDKSSLRNDEDQIVFDELLNDSLKTYICLVLVCRILWGEERGCDEGHWHAHTRGLPWGLPEVVGTVQVSRTLLSILFDLSNSVVWMGSARSFISKSSSAFNNPLETVQRALQPEEITSKWIRDSCVYYQ